MNNEELKSQIKREKFNKIKVWLGRIVYSWIAVMMILMFLPIESYEYSVLSVRILLAILVIAFIYEQYLVRYHKYTEEDTWV